MTTRHDSFPHDDGCENGELELVTTGEWSGSEYYDIWRCPECGVEADEVFMSDGFEVVPQ